MHFEAIFLSYLLVVIESQLLYYEPVQIEQSRLNNTDPLELVWIAQSWAKFRIWRDDDRLYCIVVRYSSVNEPIEPAKLFWNSSGGYHVVEDAHPNYDSGRVVYYVAPQQNRTTTGDVQEIRTLVIQNLKFLGVEYKFDFELYNKGLTKVTFSTKARTLPSTLLPSPPKIGPGCFQVSDVTEHRRLVQVFWQRIFDRTHVEALVYEIDEDEEDSKFLPEVSGPYLSRGSGWIFMSLKRHRIILTSVSETGLRSATSSVLEIPAHEDVSSALPTLVYSRERKGTYLMTWRNPEIVNGITNYTIFIVDTLDRGSVLYVEDFVHVPGNEHLLKIKGNSCMGLALSVNTVTGSSGIIIARYSN